MELKESQVANFIYLQTEKLGCLGREMAIENSLFQVKWLQQNLFFV